MTTYYARRLAGERLLRVYEAAPQRVRQYLEAEIAFVEQALAPTDTVLELGCGYGRVTGRLARVAARAVGIDNALESIELARRLAPLGAADPDTQLAAPVRSPAFAVMDALALGFPDGTFDVVACVQNGICAFRVDPVALIREALRVTRPGGRVLCSTYAERFWPYRLEWFERQVAAGLIGELDREATRDGVIACRDGFRSGTLRPAETRALCARVGVSGRITDVDGSSVFLELRAPG